MQQAMLLHLVYIKVYILKNESNLGLYAHLFHRKGFSGPTSVRFR